MFLSKVPHRQKPLIRIEGSEEESFEKGLKVFMESHLEKYTDEERSWYSHGYEYYGNILLGKRILLDVIPNVRDVSQFLKGVCIRKHILYRGGRPGGVEPDKIKHVLWDTLGIKTIVDLRGMLIFEDSYLTNDEILSRSVLWKYYTPIFENGNIDSYVQERKDLESNKREVDCDNASNNVKFLILLNSLNYKAPLRLEDGSSPAASSNNDQKSVFPLCLSCVKRYRCTELESSKTCSDEEVLIEKRREIMIPRTICYTYYLLSLVSQKFAEKWYLNKYVELKSMGGIYFDVAVFDFKTICRALKVITVSTSPILLHGNLGKDRVSVVIAIILSILGVGEEFIIRDYCASEPGLLSIKDAIETETEYFPANVNESNPENIKLFLSKMKEEFGSINAYLDLIGFDSFWRSKLCNKFCYV